VSVVVLTDSSARVPADLRDEWGLRVVPLHILLDGADLRDGVDEIPPDIHMRRATSAAATPAQLADAYRAALADSERSGGPVGVVAVHISSALSSTCGIAERTAADLDPRVRVVDSRSAAMGTGFVALAAARAAAAGADLAAVAAAARAAVTRTHAFVAVHRLDNLRRSGRGARAWLGTALSLKPLLRIQDGKLVLAQRLRTATQAKEAMIDRVCDVVGGHPAGLAVLHVANPDGAAEVAAALAQRLPVCEPAIIAELGPVLALHVGAGAIAVCVSVAPAPA